MTPLFMLLPYAHLKFSPQSLIPKHAEIFVAMEFRNPDDVDNAVTLMYYRAANALLAADPKLGETDSISRRT